ncbi:hypothetical protein MMC34_008655, partial [Xylographa carneopallida]|nr:hypothetical protein [Xylographa carneopallida]
MVLEGVVSSLLNEYLGAFIEGLDASQLSLRVWSGKVHLTNLTVKPSALDHLQLPVTVAFGRVDDLRLEANWRSLNSQPVRVELSGLHIRLQPRTGFSVDEAAVAAREVASKLSSLSAVHEFRLQAEAEAAKSSSSTASYMRRLTATIVDNVQLSVRDIHLTYTSPDTHVTLGVGLEELSAYTTDSEWKRGFFASSDITYRLVQLSNAFVYLSDEQRTVDAQQRNTLDVLNDANTRFLLSPLSGSMRATLHKDEAVSPRMQLQSSFPSIALFLAQPQYRHVLRLLSELSKSNNTLQSALLSANSSPAVQRALTRDERRRYTDFYKRTLNALWLPELTADERADMARLEQEVSYASLAQARTHGWYELKKELAGRTVSTREAGKEASKGNKGLLKGWFGQGKADISHEELTEQQREDLYAIVDAEEEKEGSSSATASHPPDWVFAQLALSLDKFSLALLDTHYTPMLQLNAEGASSCVVKRESSLLLELGVHSFTCDDSMLPSTRYPQLLAMQQQEAESKASPAFVALTFEDKPPHSDFDKRLSVQLNAPVIHLHQPLVAALLRFFELPDAVDLQSFSAWSMAQLEALRAYSTNTLADALSQHATLDLQVQLTAPTIVLPLDPLSDRSDVLVLNLGRVNINTDSVQSKEDIARTLQTLSDANSSSESDFDASVKGRFYDHYTATVSHTSLALSSRGPQWRQDEQLAYLLTPLDITVDLALCISREVNQLPNAAVTGQLPQVSLTLGNRQLARLTAFVDTFGELKTLPPQLTCALDGGQRRSDTESAGSIEVQAVHSDEKSAVGSVESSASGAESPPSKQLDVDDLTALMNGNSARAREVLSAIDRSGDGVVEWSEFVAWEHRRQRSRAHKQLVEARFTMKEAALSIQREVADGAGPAEMIVVARVSGVEVRFLKETHLMRVGVSIGRLSAQELSPQAEGRLLLDTDVAVASADAASSDAAAASAQSVQSLERGFIVVDLVRMAQESPDFDTRRVESSVDVRVGDLSLLVDIASAYRLGSFMLFEMIPAATSNRHYAATMTTAPALQPIASTTPAVTATQPPGLAASVASAAVAAVAPSSAPTGRSRSYLTRLALRASFQRLSVLVGVGRQLVSELHVSGCAVEYRQFAHALSASARLQAITLRDCTPAGRRYADVLTSLTDAAVVSGSAQSAEEQNGQAQQQQPTQPADSGTSTLVTLDYHTYSPLDLADEDNSDGAEAALTARIRGVQLVLLRRFVDENLALLLTGPVAQLIHEKRRRDRSQQQAAGSSGAASASAVAAGATTPLTQRRRSSVSAALLTPAALPSEAGGVISPLSSSHFLRLDCQLSDINLVVPYHSQSDQVVQARFDSIQASSARLPHQRTRLKADFSAFTITSSTLGVQPASLHRSAHVLTLERLAVTADSDEQAHTIEAEVEASDVRCSLSPSQYQLLLTLPARNFSEQGHVSRHMLKQLIAATNASAGRATGGSGGDGNKSEQPTTSAMPSSSTVSTAVVAAPPATRPSPATGESSSMALTLTVRCVVPRVELQLLDDDVAGSGRLLRVSVLGLGCFVTRQPDGGLEVQAGMQAVTALDNSAEGERLGAKQILPQRKELLVIGSAGDERRSGDSTAVDVPASRSSSVGKAESVCPLSLTVSRTVSVVGLNRTTVDVSLDNFRFTMGAVLLRLRSFVAAQPPALLEPEEVGEGNEDELDWDVLAAAQTAEQPPPPPSLLSARVRMTRPTFQMVADPTALVSPALLFSWSAELSVELDRSGDDERLAVGGALRDVCCYVTQLTADNDEEGNDEAEGQAGQSRPRLAVKAEAALILQPFSANLRLRQAGPLPLAMRLPTTGQPPPATSLLARRTGSFDVEGVVLRFSYSSYKLVSSTVDALIAQQPNLSAASSSSGGVRSASLSTSAGAQPFSSASLSGELDGDSVVVSDEFSVTDTSAADNATVALFCEEDVSFSVRGLHVLLINDCVASDVPLAKLSVDACSGSLHGFAHNRNARCTLTVALELFDPTLVAWSPLLEPYSLHLSHIASIVPTTSSSSSSRKHATPVEGAVRGAMTQWMQ